MSFSFPVKLFIFSKSTGCLFYVFRFDESDDGSKTSEAICKIKEQLPFYASRQMRKSFLETFSRVGSQPAVMRAMFKFLTGDDSAAPTQSQGDVDRRLVEWLVDNQESEMAYDLRENNGRIKDKKYDPFWKKLGEKLDAESVVHERREHEITYLPVAISIRALMEEIAESLPAGTPIPSKSSVRQSFWPCNPYVHAAMCYTGNYRVKRAVQQRMVKTTHVDARYAYGYLVLMKELAVRYRDHTIMLSVDDKATIPVGAPGQPLSTGVRAHHRALVPVGSTLGASDHDFHVNGLVPSIDFIVNIPENCNDSFYRGDIHVTLKEKIFEPSNPVRHATETIKILRSVHSDDDVNLNKPILLKMSDGGPDQRCTFLGVQLANLLLFMALDLDLLVHIRTAPGQSAINMAERAMSPINLALQNVSTSRFKGDDNFEERMKRLNSMTKVRRAAEKDPEIKKNLEKSMEPVIAFMKQRFSRVMWQEKYVQVHDSAREEAMRELEGLLAIFDVDCPISEIKNLDKFPKLDAFQKKHTRGRCYGYQV